MVILPRTIPHMTACRSNDPFMSLDERKLGVSEAGGLDPMFVFIALPVYIPPAIVHILTFFRFNRKNTQVPHGNITIECISGDTVFLAV